MSPAQVSPIRGFPILLFARKSQSTPDHGCVKLGPPMSATANAAALDAVIDASHRALDAFFKGDANPIKPLFLRREDVSLANPFGPPRVGWAEVEETMERAAANYEGGGAVGFEQVSKYVTPELAYTVEIEHCEAKVGGSAELTRVSLRCTTVFRLEEDGWRIAHRHADPITTPRTAESVVQG
jgi:ketosteroid isomerase-like protein